ncbi:ScbA/BarX family gamma-butyrolactone biosynthesis protein [Streptomyces sp. NPDC058326]|uniref:ScbA/BarX family gamma-butyrolactone biosynthesis protein n=1 Tax=Streptomyces sp. NPDC058326 TaxID=3346447 RepID=UPI0036E3CBBC
MEASGPATVTTGLTSTVARQYVHRATHSEVLLTAWRPAPNGFTVTAQWPRVHSFYLTTHGLHDPLLLAETVRQTSCLLAHVTLGVPIDHEVTLTTLTLHLTPSAMTPGARPVEPELRVTRLQPLHHGAKLTGATTKINIYRDGIPLATASVRLTFTCPADYDASLPPHPHHPAAHPPEPVHAPLVGRVSPHDVVLAASGTPGRWALRADPTHPVLFDHTVRHLPEALLAEAARQATTALTPPGTPTYPVTITTHMTQHATPTTPCWIEAEPLPTDALDRTRTAITALQNNQPVYHATITLDHIPTSHRAAAGSRS